MTNTNCTHHAITRVGPSSEDRTIPTLYRCATGDDIAGCGWSGFTIGEHADFRAATLHPRQPRGYRRAPFPTTEKKETS